jgi:hypothetical protein
MAGWEVGQRALQRRNMKRISKHNDGLACVAYLEISKQVSEL